MLFSRYLLTCLLGVMAACSTDQAPAPSSGSSPAGVTVRGVVGDYCPPAQATKGNC